MKMTEQNSGNLRKNHAPEKVPNWLRGNTRSPAHQPRPDRSPRIKPEYMGWFVFSCRGMIRPRQLIRAKLSALAAAQWGHNVKGGGPLLYGKNGPQLEKFITFERL